jgi:CheY-like chemotaxis protein
MVPLPQLVAGLKGRICRESYHFVDDVWNFESQQVEKQKWACWCQLTPDFTRFDTKALIPFSRMRRMPRSTVQGKMTPAQASIAVLLADDHGVVREGLRILIEAEGDIKVVGEAKTGREAVSMAAVYCPDVIVMDITIPLLNGIQAAQQILRETPKSKILILSAHADSEYVERVMAFGAVGFFTKQTSAETVGRAVRGVHAGRTFYSPSGGQAFSQSLQGG